MVLTIDVGNVQTLLRGGKYTVVRKVSGRLAGNRRPCSRQLKNCVSYRSYWIVLTSGSGIIGNPNTRASDGLDPNKDTRSAYGAFGRGRIEDDPTNPNRIIVISYTIRSG